MSENVGQQELLEPTLATPSPRPAPEPGAAEPRPVPGNGGEVEAPPAPPLSAAAEDEIAADSEIEIDLDLDLEDDPTPPPRSAAALADPSEAAPSQTPPPPDRTETTPDPLSIAPPRPVEPLPEAEETEEAETAVSAAPATVAPPSAAAPAQDEPGAAPLPDGDAPLGPDAAAEGSAVSAEPGASAEPRLPEHADLGTTPQDPPPAPGAAEASAPPAAPDSGDLEPPDAPAEAAEPSAEDRIREAQRAALQAELRDRLAASLKARLQRAGEDERRQADLDRLREQVRQRDDSLEARGRELGAAQNKVEELTAQVARLSADFDNFRRRSKREADVAKLFAAEKLLKDLLPVVDNLERALDAAPEDSPVAVGVRMVLKLFVDTLQRHGLQGFESEGTPFDPNRHEAMGLVQRDDLPGGAVAQVFHKGYMFHDRLLRAALVIVNQTPPSEAPPDPEGEPAAEADAAPPEPGSPSPEAPTVGLDPAPVEEPSGGPAAQAPPAPETAAASPAQETAAQPPAVPERDPAMLQTPLPSSNDGSMEIAGIVVAPASPALLEALQQSAGVVVQDMKVPSPFARSGLKAGDLVTAVGPRAVSDPVGFVRAVRLALQGQKALKFRYVRPDSAGPAGSPEAEN